MYTDIYIFCRKKKKYYQYPYDNNSETICNVLNDIVEKKSLVITHKGNETYYIYAFCFTPGTIVGVAVGIFDNIVLEPSLISKTIDPIIEKYCKRGGLLYYYNKDQIGFNENELRYNIGEADLLTKDLQLALKPVIDKHAEPLLGLDPTIPSGAMVRFYTDLEDGWDKITEATRHYTTVIVSKENTTVFKNPGRQLAPNKKRNTWIGVAGIIVVLIIFFVVISMQLDECCGADAGGYEVLSESALRENDLDKLKVLQYGEEKHIGLKGADFSATSYNESPDSITWLHVKKPIRINEISVKTLYSVDGTLFLNNSKDSCIAEMRVNVKRENNGNPMTRIKLSELFIVYDTGWYYLKIDDPQNKYYFYSNADLKKNDTIQYNNREVEMAPNVHHSGYFFDIKYQNVSSDTAKNKTEIINNKKLRTTQKSAKNYG